jgi:threonine synthase
MRFLSTRGVAPPASLEEAVLRGLAPDGGLYMPEDLPTITGEELKAWGEGSWPEVANPVAERFLSPALDRAALDHLLGEALNFPVPLVNLKERIRILELFHGPTLAFKDVGARFMAGLMTHFRRSSSGPLTILTATSGDTGGAVAQAFLDHPGVRVVVLFPDGKVTPRQERQFSTLGGNVVAVGVQGNFDDCQRLAKSAFGDQSLRAAVDLTSANSINVGRLLPQMFYYFKAWSEMRRGGEEVLFSVPSGNFGNLAAGLMAKAMGLEGIGFLAATNANNGVSRFLRSGHFTACPSVPTLSSAMDVGDPSNLARILHLYQNNLPNLKRDLVGRSVSDRETRECIRRTYDEFGYVLDPHSAVGLVALEQELEDRPGVEGVVLATAHPAKFAEVVEPILEQSLPIPPRLARCLEGSRTVISIEPGDDALKEILLEG